MLCLNSDTGVLTLTEIQNQTKLHEDLITSAVAQLSHSAHPILLRDDGSFQVVLLLIPNCIQDKIQMDDVYKFNDDFKSKIKRININKISKTDKVR